MPRTRAAACCRYCAAMKHNDWWRGATFYQAYPRSFADSNGDGIGDLPGLTARLDHVARLGVDGVWISPFFPSPMRDFGYDVTDHCGVDPMFGTLADFDALLARAHALGLKVVIDQVWSHTAIEHPWFVDSRAGRDGARADWYVWADAKADGSPPSNWQSWMGGPAWTWDPRRRQYYLHNFLPQMPDLNFHCPAVQDAVLDAARFWLDRGVDGFRLDTANYYHHDPALTDNPPQPPAARRARRLAGADAAAPAQRLPAAEPAVPRTPAIADGRLPRSHDGGRDRLGPCPRAHGRVHAGPAPAAHGVLLPAAGRPARPGLHRRADGALAARRWREGLALMGLFQP
jgi:glycosidase